MVLSYKIMSNKTSFAAISLRNKLYSLAKFVEYHFKFVFCVFVYCMHVILLLPVLLWQWRNVDNMFVIAQLTKYISKLFGVEISIRNPEIVSANRGAIVVINHQSALDIVATLHLWCFLRKAAIVVKKEMSYMGPLGLAIYLANGIFLNRSKPLEAYQTLVKESDIMLKNNIKIIIFPEGTRNSNQSKLLPFKKGAFNLAVDTQVPIIPIVISRYYFLDRKRHIFNGGRVVVQCMEPVSTEGLKKEDVSTLVETIRGDMEKTFRQLSDDVMSTVPTD